MISLLSAYLHYTSDALKFWSANPNPNPDPSSMKYEYTINKHVMDLQGCMDGRRIREQNICNC